ncbi:tRNA lysidine(34) synthetase TilS [Oceanisphaera arctica]|uniref:tRNA(Ile)-lysidine synthase n=1 Tax=Oceanisphaera arctica TaxID=641510 RepID=A0A2P5TKG6_9GAMM|nr:tRNA lysidine(34) synthetase TilS [Oceanisphaera arctica]PPL15640.1 tRNA lysidine(34) synthetase TilS [Oceanisphaera arctica]GHA25800.1 tRNA(Ile)-lysidine synthase [Oceanisphaera arctica]
MDLYTEFCRHTAELTPETGLLVAFSGGLDSTVLLALAARLAREQGCAVRAVHIGHGLQAAAEDWPAHCARVAESLGVTCQTIRVQVEQGPRVSLEAAAREARYKALAEVMQPDEILLTGHHLDDQSETLLLALKRGAGVAGLAAMPVRKPFGPGQQWRPLLACSRKQLETFAREQGLSWVEDPSNADDDFDRNFLRNRILPPLLQQWPSFNRTLARSAELCAEQMELALELAEQDLPALLNQAGGLSVNGLQALSLARRHNVLRHWLQQHGMYCSRSQLQAIWQELALARVDAEPEVRLGRRSIRRYQGFLYLPTDGATPHPLTSLSSGEWLHCGVGQLRLSPVTQGADLVVGLEPTRLHIAFQVSGLRARPAGRSGSRPLKKLWQEYGIPPWQRPHIPLLMQGSELVAALGLFVCKDYTPESDQPGWKLEWEPE